MKQCIPAGQVGKLVLLTGLASFAGSVCSSWLNIFVLMGVVSIYS